MSDLQCPARFLVVRSGLANHPDLTALLGALQGERIAAVYTVADPDVASAAARLATHLGMPVRPLPDTGRHDAGDPIREAMEVLADGHRGEAVALVVGVEEPIPGSPTTAPLTRIDVDSDGWRVLSEES